MALSQKHNKQEHWAYGRIGTRKQMQASFDCFCEQKRHVISATVQSKCIMHARERIEVAYLFRVASVVYRALSVPSTLEIDFVKPKFSAQDRTPKRCLDVLPKTVRSRF